MVSLSEDKKLRIRAWYDIWAFAELINFEGGRERFDAIHDDIVNFLCAPQKEELPHLRRRLLLVPRGHYKSTIASILYPLWRIYRNPNIRIGLGTRDKYFSKKFVRTIRTYLEDRDLQERVWNNRPHVEGKLVPLLDSSSRRAKNRGYHDETCADDKKIVWTSDVIQVIRSHGYVAKEATITGLAVGAAGTGDHYDLLLLDDIVHWMNSDTPNKVKSLKDWADDLEFVLDPRVERKISPTLSEKVGDEIVIVGTRYFSNDYYSNFVGNTPEEHVERLADTEYTAFVRNIYVNGRDNKDGYWLSTLNPEREERLKRRLKSARKFAAQYLNKIVADEDKVFFVDQLQFFKEYKVKGNNIVRVIINDAESVIVRAWAAIDLAVEGDDTAIAVGGMDDKGRFFLLDLKWGRWNPGQQIDELNNTLVKWDLSSYVTENVGGYFKTFQWHMMQAYRKDPKKYRRAAVHETRANNNKEARITFWLEPLFSTGSFYILPWMKSSHCPLVQQLDYWKSGTEKDDVLDAIEDVIQRATPTKQPTSEDAADGLKNVVRFGTRNRMFGGCR